MIRYIKQCSWSRLLYFFKVKVLFFYRICDIFLVALCLTLEIKLLVYERLYVLFVCCPLKVPEILQEDFH